MRDHRAYPALLHMLVAPLLALSFGVMAQCPYALITNDASHVHFDDVSWLNHFLHTAPGLILLAILGALVFVALLHLAHGAAWIQAQIVQGMLPRE